MKRLLLAAGAVLLAGSASAQVTVPQVTSIGPNDLFQDVVNGVPSAQSYYASGSLLGNFGATNPGNSAENALIGGDFGQNLFQDGTTTTTITTTPTYVADQWAEFSGTSTALSGSQQTGASDIPAGYSASLRVQRTGNGVVQSCVAQVVPTVTSVRFQGLPAEFDFHAYGGSGFSAAGANLSVILVQGTGTNDSLANLAKTINSALSGTAWAGAVVDTVLVPITIQGWNRYGAVFPIAATTTQIGVALCWTPVGTPSSDFFQFTGAQLVPNSALATLASTAGGALQTNDRRAKSFNRRQNTDETNLQLAFYWRQNEAANTLVPYGTCQGGAAATTAANCFMQFPVTMFKVPTLAYTAGTISASVGTAGAVNAVSALTIQASGASTNSALLTATVTSVATITGFLEAGNSTGGGKIAFSARF